MTFRESNDKLCSITKCLVMCKNTKEITHKKNIPLFRQSFILTKKHNNSCNTWEESQQ